jgi:hypothetical protein
MARDLECVGMHSLFSEPDRNGTDRERHILQVDLDDKAALARPKEFREDVLRLMRSYGIMDTYVFETMKGVHLWSPWMNSRRFMERFSEDIGRRWGGDRIQRMVGWRNGGTMLRVTPKPGEGAPCQHPGGTVSEPKSWPIADCPWCLGTGWTGPRYVAHLRLKPNEAQPWSFWSGTHFDFMAKARNLKWFAGTMIEPMPRERRVECQGVRLEHYYTYKSTKNAAEVKKESAAPRAGKAKKTKGSFCLSCSTGLPCVGTWSTAAGTFTCRNRGAPK